MKYEIRGCALQNELKAEVDHNYDYFQRNILNYLENHAGQYALLKSASVIGFFDGPGSAYRRGLSLFPDQIFSVQLVTDEPAELGLMSVAIA
jgi:hypothetical protein